MTTILHETQLLTRLGCILILLIVKSVRTSLAAAADPSLLELESCVLWNAALCKPAFMKSLYLSATADLALDGNRNPVFDGGSCFHTDSYSNNWWLVDLMNEYMVHKVVITNRVQYGYRFKSVFVDLFLTDPRNGSSFPLNTEGVLCAEVTESFDGTKTFECSSPTYARYVKFLKTAYAHFSACEFEVMVSKKRGGGGRKKRTKSFTIMKDSTAENGVVVDNAVTSTAQACVQLCTGKDDLCNGVYWTEDTRVCQILSVNPYDVGQLVENSGGTDFYVESTIRCIGDGEWEHVW